MPQPSTKGKLHVKGANMSQLGAGKGLGGPKCPPQLGFGGFGGRCTCAQDGSLQENTHHALQPPLRDSCTLRLRRPLKEGRWPYCGQSPMRSL